MFKEKVKGFKSVCHFQQFDILYVFPYIVQP